MDIVTRTTCVYYRNEHETKTDTYITEDVTELEGIHHTRSAEILRNLIDSVYEEDLV
jgi:hypothetical protein